MIDKSKLMDTINLFFAKTFENQISYKWLLRIFGNHLRVHLQQSFNSNLPHLMWFELQCGAASECTRFSFRQI